MQRIGRRTRLKPGCEAEYQRWHRQAWPEIQALTRRAGVTNYSIFLDGRDLFSYLEVEDWTAALQTLASDPVSQRWQELMAPLMDAVDPDMPWLPLEEVYHQD
jgi:L-rhamnose mutarotase